MRISFRKECIVESRSAGTLAGKMLCDARSEVIAEDGPEAGSSGEAVAGSGFSSVFSIFSLPRIYNTFFTAHARIDFHPGTGRIRVAVFFTARSSDS
jgi:hypothetical protein